jgi:hypothetical protein
MSLRIEQRCEACKAQILVARSAYTGQWFRLNADDVPPRTRGALVLIGETAFTEPAGVAQLARSFPLDDATAHRELLDGYGWHLPHKVTCKGRM